jgi:hypothetical protein
MAGLMTSEKIWTDRTFWHKSGSGGNFAMTSPDTLNTKVVINELSFPMVNYLTPNGQ